MKTHLRNSSSMDNCHPLDLSKRIFIAAGLAVAIATSASSAQLTDPATSQSATDPTIENDASNSFDATIVRKYKPAPFMHDAIPIELGCHVETTPGTLVKVDCLTPEEVAKLPPPAPCKGADGTAACGMETTVIPATYANGSYHKKELPPITEAYLEDTVQQYSSSDDSAWGKGAYSLQLNSNYFDANSKTTGWVQFVYQNFLTSARFCVWNNSWPTDDSSKTKYDSVCTSMQSIPLGERLQFTVGGFVCGGECTYFRKGGTKGPPVIWGWLHWAKLDIDGKVCSSCATGTVWAVATDSLGLAKNWQQISGSVLGTSNSGINFKSKAVIRNVLAATACSIPEAPGWTCVYPQLSGQYADTAGWVTAEGNNLFYAPSPNWVKPQVPQSSLECSEGFCSLTAYEIYPK